MPLLRNILIAILLVGMTFTIFINLYSDMYSNYSPYTNISAREEELNQSYSKWNESQDLIVEISDKIRNSTSRATTGSENLITSSYGVARLYLSNIQSIFETLINKVAFELGIIDVGERGEYKQSHITQTFIAIILISIIFAIVSGVLRHEW